MTNKGLHHIRVLQRAGLHPAACRDRKRGLEPERRFGNVEQIVSDGLGEIVTYASNIYSIYLASADRDQNAMKQDAKAATDAGAEVETRTPVRNPDARLLAASLALRVMKQRGPDARARPNHRIGKRTPRCRFRLRAMARDIRRA